MSTNHNPSADYDSPILRHMSTFLHLGPQSKTSAIGDDEKIHHFFLFNDLQLYRANKQDGLATNKNFICRSKIIFWYFVEQDITLH